VAERTGSDPTDVPNGVPEDRVDVLYGFPLDEFTPARDTLAKELRKEGQREAAEWVRRLPKPSAPAWVVNQLARTQSAEVKELEAAGQALRDTHELLIAGKVGSEELGLAGDRQREAIAGLIDKAQGLLDSNGQAPSRATLEKAGQTLEAVALDDQTRSAFATGRVTRESRPVGLGLLGGAAFAPPPAPERKPDRRQDKRGDDARAKERARIRKELETAKEEERVRRRAIESAEQEAEQARREVERARSRLETAESELERARAAHEESRSRLQDLEEAFAKLARSSGRG